MSVLLDAGPVLNFLAVSEENCLIQFAAASNMDLATAERVDREIQGMARNPRFVRTPVARKWPILTGARIRLLDDDLSTAEFADAIARISGRPAADRIRDRASLGEILVIAHASVMVQAAIDVIVLIDEKDGRLRADKERRHLQDNGAPGTFRLLKTEELLRISDRQGWLRASTWADAYDSMRNFDDGLPPRLA